MRDVSEICTSSISSKLLALPRMAEKSASNVLAAIESSKSRGLARLLSGMGIRFVGAQNAAILAGDFGTMDALAAATEEQLVASEGIGVEIARSVVLFFAQAPNRAMIARLKQAGRRHDGAAARTREPDGALAGKTLVLTGTLPSLTRDEAAELIVAAGGKVVVVGVEEDRLCRGGRRSGQQARQSGDARHRDPRRSRIARAARGNVSARRDANDDVVWGVDDGRFAERVGDVACNDAARAPRERDAAGAAVPIRAGARGVERRQPLREQRRDRARQHVAGTCGGERVRSGRVDVRDVAAGDQRRAAFEQRRDAVLVDEGAQRARGARRVRSCLCR